MGVEQPEHDRRYAAADEVMKAFTSVLGSRIRCSTMRSYPAK